MVLDDPQSTILDRGGYICLAMADNKIVGTAALMKEHGNEYELAKMAVTAEYRGKGISKLLMNTCIKIAEEKKWHRLYLYSNTLLVPAIQLYRRYEFKEIPVGPDSHYNRTNIKMELKLY